MRSHTGRPSGAVGARVRVGGDRGRARCALTRSARQRHTVWRSARVEEGERALLFRDERRRICAPAPRPPRRRRRGGGVPPLPRPHRRAAHIHGRGVVHRDVKLASARSPPTASSVSATLVTRRSLGRRASGCTSAAARDRSARPRSSHAVLRGTKGRRPTCGRRVWSPSALLSGHLPFDVADDGADWRFAKVAEAQAGRVGVCDRLRLDGAGGAPRARRARRPPPPR